MRMPDIWLPSTTGGLVSLAGVAGGVVAFCYPWTGRPGMPNPPDWDTIPGAHGSTPEAEDFRNLHSAFADISIGVLGISMQSGDDQREFSARLRLPFPLLSDADGALVRALRLPTFTTGGAAYMKRLTLFARDGRLQHVFYPVHPPHAHAREVLAWVTAVGTYADEARPKPAPR
jgi:peroxiredoxin